MNVVNIFGRYKLITKGIVSGVSIVMFEHKFFKRCINTLIVNSEPCLKLKHPDFSSCSQPS